jgi:hypothetical protein
MSKAARVWKHGPLRAACEPVNAQGTQAISKRYTVAFISRNALLRKFLNGPPCQAKYEFSMFTTVHGHKLAFHDIILLDNGLSPFTIESYIGRSHAKRSQRQSNVKKSEAKPGSTETTKTSPSKTWPPESRPFPDFAQLYDEYKFPSYAEVTERLLAQANKNLDKWKSHLVDEAGFAAIRVKDPTNNRFVAKRCVLLPSTALLDWKEQLNPITNQWLDLALEQFPRTFLEKCQEDEKEMQKLFYVKAAGEQNPERKKFVDVPPWKLEIMLKKWRTDRALEEWSAKYQQQSPID